jgi:hypothetical protein
VLPKEHGAYGQLLFPLGTALALGQPGIGAVLVTVAAVSAFLAHEPLLVLLGQRGPRAARDERERARRWFASSAVVAALCGIGAMVILPPAARLALLVPVSLALVLGALILWRHERTVAGEVLAAVALSSLSAPVALASGASTMAAVTCACGFAAALVAGTIAVRAVIMHARQPPAIGPRVVSAIMSVGCVEAIAALSQSGRVASAALVAVLPMCGLACALAAFPPPARHLRVVGWGLVLATTATAGILVGLLR